MRHSSQRPATGAEGFARGREPNSPFAGGEGGVMARHKNIDWTLPDGISNQKGGWTIPWEALNAAVLMDIRDELQKVNRRLDCHETLAIPRYLSRIARNTVKPKRKRK